MYPPQQQQQGQPQQPQQAPPGYDPNAPHPTVPYGQQQAPPQQPQQYQQQPPQGQQQPQQPQQFQQQQPAQQFQQPASFPFGQQQAPQQQQQGPRSLQVDDGMILDGPNVPTELRGRTFGQVKSIYTALATDWLNRQRAAGQSPATQAPQQPSAPQQSAPQQQAPAAQAAAGRRWDWSNPEESIAEVVRREVGGMLQPLQQQSTGQAVAQARAVAQQQIRDFGELEGRIMQKLAGVDPQALTNPDIWVNAARLVRGEMLEQGQYPGYGGQRNGGGYSAVPQYDPAPQNPLGAARFAPAPQVGQFFSEAPTPPGVNEYGSGGLTAQEIQVAKAMGMSAEQYALWKGGIQR